VDVHENDNNSDSKRVASSSSNSPCQPVALLIGLSIACWVRTTHVKFLSRIRGYGNNREINNEKESVNL
jgi:hypothetical protein